MRNQQTGLSLLGYLSSEAVTFWQPEEVGPESFDTANMPESQCHQNYFLGLDAAGQAQSWSEYREVMTI